MYLLDTNVILYFLSHESRLPEKVVSFIDTHQDEIVISLISSWEISIKKSLGKLEVQEDPIRFLIDKGIQSITLELEDIEALEALPPYHKDPFDRILLSQAIRRQWNIITVDKIFTKYTNHIWLAR